MTDSSDRPAGVFSRIRRGMRDVSVDQLVAAPAQTVWALVSDVARIAEWWPRAVSGEVVEGEGLGRVQTVRLDWGRVEGVVRQAVTEYQPGARYGWTVLSEAAGDRVLPPLASTHIVVEISSERGQSRVRIRAEYLPAGVRGAVALRQLSRLARRTFRKALNNLEGRLSSR